MAPVAGAFSLWVPTGRRREAARGRRAMPLPWPSLLLLWAGLGSFGPGSRCGSPRHSLRYSYLRVSESSQELPQFLSVILLDDQPITRYDNHTSGMKLLVPWMGAEDKTILVALERVFRTDLEWLSRLSHQTGGLHTWQAILGCELGEDGSKGGFLHYGYNGMDFISFDKETLRWVAAQRQAEKVKEMWDHEPRRSQRNKVYLEEMCIRMMQKCLSYQKESLKKTEPPVGKVSCKVVDDSLEVLICQAFGFYPKEIQATWTRDGENWEQETFRRNVAPNSDGTYYVWLSIEIDPKEREHFQCHLEHEGLQEPLVLTLKEETAGVWRILLGIVGAVVVIVVVLILFRAYRQRRRLRRKFCHAVANLHLPQINRSPSMDGTEDEMQSQRLPQPKTTSEASYGPQKTGSDPEIIVLARRKVASNVEYLDTLSKSQDQSKINPKSKPTKALQNILSKPKDSAATEGKPGFIYILQPTLLRTSTASM